MISLLIFLFILGLLIIVHEFGHFIAARKMGVRVETFSLGFGPRILGKKKNDTEYSVNAVPLGGYVKLAGDSVDGYKGTPDEYLSKSLKSRLAIVFFGPFLNYVLGFLCFWLIFFIGYPTLTTKIGGLVEGFGAEDAGMRVGDKISAVDGKRVNYWEDLQKIIQNKRTTTKVCVNVLRDNKEYAIDVIIKEKQVSDQLGQSRTVGLLGIMPFDEFVILRHGFVESFFLGLNKTWQLTFMTYRALGLMITGKLSMRESVTGPLGVFFIASKAASLGIIAVLHLIALLNVSLAIFNLLPLPVLDGGHIALLAVEKIRGRCLSIKEERVITKIGFTIIISLAMLATYNDILRVFGDRISKFMVK